MHLGLLKKGQTAVIVGLSDNCNREIKERLLDLGFVRGAHIAVQNVSPLNNPTAYNIHDTIISLRNEDARHVLIKITNKE